MDEKTFLEKAAALLANKIIELNDRLEEVDHGKHVVDLDDWAELVDYANAAKARARMEERTKRLFFSQHAPRKGVRRG